MQQPTVSPPNSVGISGIQLHSTRNRVVGLLVDISRASNRAIPEHAPSADQAQLLLNGAHCCHPDDKVHVGGSANVNTLETTCQTKLGLLPSDRHTTANLSGQPISPSNRVIDFLGTPARCRFKLLERIADPMLPPVRSVVVLLKAGFA